MRPGGARAIVAESLLLKQQLLIVTRSRRRAPDLRPLDRVVAGLCAGLTGRARIRRCAIVLKPATILGFQRLLVKRKYKELFSPKRRGRPGPKGPSAELIAAVVEMKRRNPRFGYQRIADQVNLAFDVPEDKHLVRRVLAKHCGPDPGSDGPSWLTFLGNSKDSLWSVDLFRCESLILRTHRVMVVMDQFTRRIVGFPVCGGAPDGPTVCRMLRHIILDLAPPTYLSSDHDPLFEYHRWKANLRILGVKAIKTVPFVVGRKNSIRRWNLTLSPRYGHCFSKITCGSPPRERGCAQPAAMHDLRSASCPACRDAPYLQMYPLPRSPRVGGGSGFCGRKMETCWKGHLPSNNTPVTMPNWDYVHRPTVFSRHDRALGRS